MKCQDDYATLGVARDAAEDEIKKADRKLARRYHPALSNEPHGQEKFKAMTEAYEVRKDSEKRGAYDERGQNWQGGQDFRPPPDWSGFAGHRGFTKQHGNEAFEFDVFSDLFPAFYNAEDGNRPPPRPSQDAHTTFYPTLEQLYADLPVKLDLSGAGACQSGTPPALRSAGRVRRVGRLIPAE